jgi:hypothetical protein
MEEESLSMDDLNLLVELKKGNIQAASKLIGDANIDSLDLDADEAKGYKANNYAPEPVSFEMETVQDTIKRDVEVLPKVEEALNTMPEPFFNDISGNPTNLNALYLDVKSGVYEQVMPEMQKLATLNGQVPSVDLYRQAANIVASRTPRKEEVANTPQPKVNPAREQARSEKRKAAASGTRKKGAAKPIKVNFDDLDDEAFEKEFQRMTGRAISDYS